MAEERLIDDDKDKKYKIRKNAEGVDELYIDGEPEEELTFEIPEFETDDEEAAVMTPEQLAAREKMREDEERRRVEKIADLIQKAERALEEGNYDSARYHLAEAAETDGKNGEIRFLQLKALTQNFTDFTLASDAAEAAEGVKAYCTPEQKNALKEISAPLSERLSQTEKELETLGKAQKGAYRVCCNRSSSRYLCSCGGNYGQYNAFPQRRSVGYSNNSLCRSCVGCLNCNLIHRA